MDTSPSPLTHTVFESVDAHKHLKIMQMPIYSKTFKNLLQKQKCDDHETWYEASMIGALQTMYKI